MEFNFATINAQWYYFKFVGASTLNSSVEEDFVISFSITNLPYVVNGKVSVKGSWVGWNFVQEFVSRLWHRTQLIWTVIRYWTLSRDEVAIVETKGCETEAIIEIVWITSIEKRNVFYLCHDLKSSSGDFLLLLYFSFLSNIQLH